MRSKVDPRRHSKELRSPEWIATLFDLNPANSFDGKFETLRCGVIHIEC
jgi:hypothetical protein